jgi:hypothetical protein
VQNIWAGAPAPLAKKGVQVFSKISVPSPRPPPPPHALQKCSKLFACANVLKNRRIAPAGRERFVPVKNTFGKVCEILRDFCKKYSHGIFNRVFLQIAPAGRERFVPVLSQRLLQKYFARIFSTECFSKIENLARGSPCIIRFEGVKSIFDLWVCACAHKFRFANICE